MKYEDLSEEEKQEFDNEWLKTNCSVCNESLTCMGRDKETGKAYKFQVMGMDLNLKLESDVSGRQIREMERLGLPYQCRICWPCWLKSLGVKGKNETKN